MQNYTPLKWDWTPVVTGDTYPGINITCDGPDSDLARVRIDIKAAGSTAVALGLDSDTNGVTINDATAWDFTIDSINPVNLAPGVFYYDLETTDAAGTIRTEFNGSWQIIKEATI